MKHNIFVTLALIMAPATTLADSLRVGCVKLERLCSEKDRCVWWGNPGQALNVELIKSSETADSELYKGSLDTVLEGQKFKLSVLQKRMVNKSPINYINLEMPITKEVSVASEGLVYSHVKYVNKQQGVTIRCSTGI
jgi:hypothetical protein